MHDLSLYLTACGQVWLAVFMAFCLVNGIVAHLYVHLMIVGLLICLVCYFRLPPPDLTLVRRILGPNPITEKSELVDWEIAHRAACLDAPENSLEAVRLAAKNGARMVEFDVSFTSDGQAVAFHDNFIDRVTSGTGRVDKIPLGRLQQLNLAEKHPLAVDYGKVVIPTVDDFVKECLEHNLRIIIDLKTFKQPEETKTLILGLYKKYPALRTSAMITSFYPQLLYKIRSIDPSIVCSISWRPHFIAYSSYDGPGIKMRPRYEGIQHMMALFADVLYTALLPRFVYFFVGISAVLVNRNVVNRDYINNWHHKGVRVVAWTVNSPLEKAFIRETMGISVLTDTLDRAPPEVEKWLYNSE